MQNAQLASDTVQRHALVDMENLLFLFLYVSTGAGFQS